MKRKSLFVLLCLVILCRISPLDSWAVKLDSKDVDWGITLSVEDVTPTGMVVVVHQSGGTHAGDLEYGSSFHLEVWKNEAWEPVPYIQDNVAWMSMAYLLSENTTTHLHETWDILYGALEPGRYRYVKEFTDFRYGGDGYDDAELTLPVVLLLVCTVTLTIVWNKTRNTTK